MAPAPLEWPDLLRVATLALRSFTLPCRFFIVVFSATFYASLVERWLAYITTFSVSVMFDVVRLVEAAQSSAVACTILAKYMEISMLMFAMPAPLYPPLL